MKDVPAWLIVTPEQLKKGWIEMRGISPTHHNYIVLGQREDGNYVVRNPELSLNKEDPVKKLRRV